MRRKMIDGRNKRSYARIKSPSKRYRNRKGAWMTRKTNIELFLNSGTVRHCRLVKGEKVDLFYERRNKVWEMPVLIVRKNGTQRTLSGPAHGKWLFIAIGTAVGQWDLPLVLRRDLEILDYVDDTGEIYIDITNEAGTIREIKEKRESMNERMSYQGGKNKSQIFAVTRSLKEKIKLVAKREDRPMNQVIINALENYLIENHPDV